MYQPGQLQPEEPIEFRSATKSKIHEDVSRQYFLPDIDSRCCSRLYLIQVSRGDVFRVRRQDLLTFEVGLLAEMTTKSSFFNVSLLKERASIYLTQLGYPPFGFPVNTNPDEPWFTRVLRYIDPCNILGAFKVRIPGAPFPRCLAGRV